MVAKCLDGKIDGFAGQLGFVALHVHDQVDIDQLGDLCGAIGAAPRLRASHNDGAAKATDGHRNLRIIGGDTDAVRKGRRQGRFVGMLDQRLAGFVQQHLARQTR